MGGPKSKASHEEIISVFHTEEPFKAFAARIGMSPNTLRDIWKAEFGEAAFFERGKRLQAKAASAVAKASAAAGRVYRDVELVCSSCGRKVILKSNQVGQMDDPSKFICHDCRGDRKCPICGLAIEGKQGLSTHFRCRQKAGDAAHTAYLEDQANAVWAGKTEGEDYVTCLECGHKAETLARHLKAAHGLDAVAYTNKHGSGVPIRADKVTQNMSKAALARCLISTGKGEVKTVACPSCGVLRKVSKFIVPGVHELRCSDCRKKDEDLYWSKFSEPQDFVTCLECGYRAENLTSHLQNSHPEYRKKYPEALVVALGSEVRNKDCLKNVPLSLETRQKMSRNAGRWNKGLTKESDSRIAALAKKCLGRVSWNTGLTADKDERVRSMAEKLKLYVGDSRPWSNGLAANLTLDDFKPFLDLEGCVDHRAVIEKTGFDEVTIRKWMKIVGLKPSKKYIKNAAEARIVRIEKADLERFRLANGKVVIGRVMVGLRHTFQTVRRECKRHGLPTCHQHIRQTRFLDIVSKILGVPYEEEWNSRRFVNPVSGRRFKFDGYFPSIGLIVEFHGHQHYTFPNVFMPHESYRPLWEAMLERDRIKKVLIDATPDLIWFSVLEKEPWEDVSYLKGRLIDSGVLPEEEKET